LKRVISIFFIICGLGIAVLLIIPMITGATPEIETEPISIILHIIAGFNLSSNSLASFKSTVSKPWVLFV